MARPSTAETDRPAALDPTPNRRHEHFDRLPQLENLDVAETQAGRPARIRRSGPAVVGSSHLVRIGGKPVQLAVRARCAKGGGRPTCVTHGESFDSVEALAAHCADDRDHVTAWFCAEPTELSYVTATGAVETLATVHGLESDKPWNT